jgi:hypothetical protein
VDEGAVHVENEGVVFHGLIVTIQLYVLALFTYQFVISKKPRSGD